MTTSKRDGFCAAHQTATDEAVSGFPVISIGIDTGQGNCASRAKEQTVLRVLNKGIYACDRDILYGIS